MTKKLSFLLYGLMIGALAAVFGSIIYGPLAIVIVLWGTDFGSILTSIGYAGLYAAMFTVLPGALCGAYLAYWLSNAERTAGEITRRGLIVGAFAGALSSAAVIALLLLFFVDSYVIGFSLSAILMAAGMGALGAKWLERIKGKRAKNNLESNIPLP